MSNAFLLPNSRLTGEHAFLWWLNAIMSLCKLRLGLSFIFIQILSRNHSQTKPWSIPTVSTHCRTFLRLQFTFSVWFFPTAVVFSLSSRTSHHTAYKFDNFYVLKWWKSLCLVAKIAIKNVLWVLHSWFNLQRRLQTSRIDFCVRVSRDNLRFY